METLVNKQYKDYTRVSRYSIFPYYYNRFDEKYVYGTTAHLKTEGITYVNHKVVRGDTLDTMALHYYNNPTYYWIIADFNKIQNPFAPLQEGTTLKVPTFSSISFDI